MASSFICPYCSQPTTITSPNEFREWTYIIISKSNKGEIGFTIHAITCPNPDCNKLFLEVFLTDARRDGTTNWKTQPTKILQVWKLLPESQAKVLPDYIPAPVTEDYYEACRIRDLSPKASATLARRCLQGMIRDFWKISKPTLKSEIDELKMKIDPDTWDSIEAVRKVGNIGAHMEKDINLIVEVESKEAQLLIGLIEQLIEDWYIAREKRRERTKQLTDLAQAKQKQKSSDK